MSRAPEPSVSELLVKWREGDEVALNALMPRVYAELHRLAHLYLRKQHRGHILQSTALVNEFYLKLLDMNISWQNRAHFFGVAAIVMRAILVDYARAQRAAKRGGGALQVSLSKVQIYQNEDAIDLLDLHEALTSLAVLDPRQSRIVELRYFAGLSIEETAEVLDISPATVKREWTMARTWLHKRMFKGAG